MRKWKNNERRILKVCARKYFELDFRAYIFERIILNPIPFVSKVKIKSVNLNVAGNVLRTLKH